VLAFCGDAAGRVEAVLEPLAELAKILRQAVPGIGVVRVGRLDLDQSGPQQSFDRVHGDGEPVALELGQRLQDRPGQLVTEAVQLPALGTTRRRQADHPDAAVVPVGMHIGQPV
jgi:hypothetical protein